MVKFIQTGDWQLGMTRHFLAGEAQERFSEARLDATRAIARLAREENCDFVVVCGDVFESNQVDRRVVIRALDALGEFSVPVYLLPGNHDPLNAASVYRSRAFASHCPAHVVVLEEAGRGAVPGLAVELVAAPWSSKAPLEDLAAGACADLAQDDGVLRVLVAHGAVDALAPDPSNPSLIRLAGVEQAVRSGLIHYVALGDRHSVTGVGSTGRVWYAGSPLATDYGEVEPNCVLVVTLERDSVEVGRRRTGTWQFLRESFDVNSRSEVDAVAGWLSSVPEKRSTVAKLSFVGTLSLADKAHLDAILEHHLDLFAALEIWDRQTELLVRPDDADRRDPRPRRLRRGGHGGTAGPGGRHGTGGGDRRRRPEPAVPADGEAGMRIRRIVLRNFKGVTSREIHIPAEGVTVVEGPNETGKSSLAEAIDLIFEEPDGSAKQRVKAVKPVGADVGAEVEVELTVGAYHVVYWKRWHKQPQTTLRVLAPRPQQYTGREAHDRMNEILDESIDRALWKALRYQQGIGIAQAAVGDSLSLLTALDAAAAGKGLGDQGEAEDLWSRVREERERYFTPTGRPNAARGRLDAQVAASGRRRLASPRISSNWKPRRRAIAG